MKPPEANTLYSWQPVFRPATKRRSEAQLLPYMTSDRFDHDSSPSSSSTLSKMHSNATLLLRAALLFAPTTFSASKRSVLSWDVADTTPEGAGPPVYPDFPGFAFEVASFYDYAIDANGNPNTFSRNLIYEVLDRTGGTPILRVGGTSGDHGSYNVNFDHPVNRPATLWHPESNAPFLEIGHPYFKAFESFPNAKFIFMVPLKSRNTPNSIAWAKGALSKIKNLDAFELGNEPDYYPWFSIDNYVQAYNDMREKMTAAIPRQRDRAIFQGVDKAWEASTTLPIGEVQNRLKATGAIKQYAYHYYQSAFSWSDSILENQIASHSYTVKSMARLRPNIDFLRENGHAHVPFLMDEVGANMLQTEGYNNLATALWGVDWQLHCMSIGVNRVN